MQLPVGDKNHQKPWCPHPDKGECILRLKIQHGSQRCTKPRHHRADRSNYIEWKNKTEDKDCQKLRHHHLSQSCQANEGRKWGDRETCGEIKLTHRRIMRPRPVTRRQIGKQSRLLNARLKSALKWAPFQRSKNPE